MALLFGVCFFLYLLKLSAGFGFWSNTLGTIPYIDAPGGIPQINLSRRYILVSLGITQLKSIKYEVTYSPLNNSIV